MRNRYRSAIACLILLGLTSSGWAQSAQPSPTPKSAASIAAEEASVRRTAENWLGLLDGGKIAEGWRALSSSASTAAAVTESSWQVAIAQQRQEYGSPKGREFKKANLFAKAQTGGDADFYLVEFDAVSIERGALRELVRVIRDPDGQWRVAGYTVGQKHPGGGDDD